MKNKVKFSTKLNGKTISINHKIPNQGITKLSNELGLISTEVSQNIERWTTRGAK